MINLLMTKSLFKGLLIVGMVTAIPSIYAKDYTDEELLEITHKVNSEVNSGIQYIYFKGYSNKIWPKQGNCTDFAATKAYELVEKYKIDWQDVKMVTYKLWDGQYHTVVAVTGNHQYFYLDNMKDHVSKYGPGTFEHFYVYQTWPNGKLYHPFPTSKKSTSFQTATE